MNRHLILKSLMVIALLIVPAGVIAGQTAVTPCGCSLTAASCPVPTMDLTQDLNGDYAPLLQGAGPRVVDPQATCGAFCVSQTPTGWPWSWNSEYWLRPDSNL
jgi:hypothetical protein